MRIQVMNSSTHVNPSPFAAACAAVSKQVNGDFAICYNLGPTTIEMLKPGDKFSSDPTVWQHILADTSTSPGALGYHDNDEHGKPRGFTFVATTIADGGDWRVTFSHEILEQRKDPYCTLWCFTPDGKLRAYEMCDAVENDSYTITVGTEQVPVSNFVTEEYFADQPTGLATDHMGTLKGQVAPARSDGGYDLVINTSGQVTQEFSDHARAMSAHKREAKSFSGSRTSRRLAHAAKLAEAIKAAT